MALPTSGNLTLNQIHVEAGGSSGSACTLNDTDIRGLNAASGYTIPTTSGSAIEIGDFYGASQALSFVINNGSGAYTGGVDDIAEAKKLITPKLVTEKNAIMAAYRNLTKIPGGKSFMSALPVVGLGLGVAESKERTEKAAKTKNPVDALQATLSSAGLAPGVGIIPDAINGVIDVFRWAMNKRPLSGAPAPLQSPYHQQ